MALRLVNTDPTSITIARKHRNSTSAGFGAAQALADNIIKIANKAKVMVAITHPKPQPIWSSNEPRDVSPNVSPNAVRAATEPDSSPQGPSRTFRSSKEVG